MEANQYLGVLTILRDRAERSGPRVAEAQAAEAQAKDTADRAAAALDAAPDDPHAMARARATLDQAKIALTDARTAREEAEATARGTHRALVEHEAKARAALNDSTAALRATVSAEFAALDAEWTEKANALLAVAAKVAALDNAAGTMITVRSRSPWEKTPEAIYLMGDGPQRTLGAVRVPKLMSGGSVASDRLVDVDKAREAAHTVAAFGELAERHAALDRLAQVAAAVGRRQAAE